MAGDNGDREVLDHCGTRGGDGARALLRGVPPTRGLTVTGLDAELTAGLVAAVLAAEGLAVEVVAVVTGGEETSVEVAGRRVPVTLGPPGPGEVGMVRQQGGPPLIVDRCFAPGAPANAELLVALDELAWVDTAERLTCALAAAALTRAYGVAAESVARGLARHAPQIPGSAGSSLED